MKGLFRKTALLAVLAAFIMLVGARVVPHHHCGGASLSGGTAVATHFGYGVCEECSHSRCCGGHEHDSSRCCDDTEYYSRQAGDEEELCLKTFVQQPLCIASLPSVQFCNLFVKSPVRLFYNLKIPDRGVTFVPLRAPPVA